MDRRLTDPCKLRTASDTSTTSSITEYVNEIFEDSELGLSKVVSVQVTEDLKWVKNPMTDGDIKFPIKLHNDCQFSVDTTTSEVPKKDSFSILNIRKMYLTAFVVLLFPVCMGMTATYSATATMDMLKPHSSIHPNGDEITWIGSLMAIGALIGGAIAGFFTNILGRKGTLMLNSIPFVIGWLLIAYAPSIGVIYAGRVLSGICSGVVTVATPMYLVEISTPEVRGFLGSSFQLFVVIGVLIVSVLGSVLTWRYLAISGGIISFIAALLMALMPESPKWLIMKQKRQEVEKAILFLQGREYNIEADICKMEEDMKLHPEGSISFKEFKVPTAYKPLILSILLMFFQQFSGVNAVMFYCVQIFESAHSSVDATTATIIVATVQVIATLTGSLLVDKAGRKILLLISSSCMTVSLTIFGGFDLAKFKDKSAVEAYGWVPLVCLITFVAAFSIGFGPTPWLLVAEMTSVRIRSTISGIATALNWLFVFTVTKLYLIEEKVMHTFGVYWMYAGFCFLSLLFTFFFVPETKGKSLEEIQKSFIRTSKIEEKQKATKF